MRGVVYLVCCGTARASWKTVSVLAGVTARVTAWVYPRLLGIVARARGAAADAAPCPVVGTPMDDEAYHQA